MIKLCQKIHLNTCVDIAYSQNCISQHNCAYCASTKNSIFTDFENLLDNSMSLIVGYFNYDDELLGLFGFYFNHFNNWVDCIGPFFKINYDQTVTKNMFEFAQKTLIKANRFNFYFNIKNRNTHDLMLQLKSTKRDNEYILSINHKDYKPLHNSINIINFEDKYSNNIISLHEDSFKDIYVSGQNIVESSGKNRKIFCALNSKEEFVGYGILAFNITTNYLCAEIFAVKKEYQNMGYGRSLLNKVISHGFTNYNCDNISLVVDKLNTNAASLYYSCGFKLIVENESYFYGSNL